MLRQQNLWSHMLQHKCPTFVFLEKFLNLQCKRITKSNPISFQWMFPLALTRHSLIKTKKAFLPKLWFKILIGKIQSATLTDILWSSEDRKGVDLVFDSPSFCQCNWKIQPRCQASASYQPNLAHRLIKYSYSKEGQEQHKRTFLTYCRSYSSTCLEYQWANTHGGKHR